MSRPVFQLPFPDSNGKLWDDLLSLYVKCFRFKICHFRAVAVCFGVFASLWRAC
jgi:hypothetical protein